MSQIENMKEMIRCELQTISSLEDRVALKELMERVFLPLYETNLEMYRELEQRIQEELAYDVNRYLIRTGIVDRRYVDLTHHLMAPMDNKDLEESSYRMDELLEAVQAEGEYPLMTVMLRCDFIELRELWKKDPEFTGTIETENPKRTWEIKVKLKKNTRYLEKTAELYRLFIKNGIPWQTINAPYLYKMADVVLVKAEEGLTGKEKIAKIEIQFGQCSSFIHYHMVPLWNVRQLLLDSVGFPVPCEDHQNYEHIISIQEYGTGHAYLADDNQELGRVVQRENKLFIVSRAGEAKKWSIYTIRNGTESRIDYEAYPVMKNHRTESFSEGFRRRWNLDIKTRAELARFIRGFGMEDFVYYQDCEVLDRYEEETETYSMNPFVEDEIRDTSAQKKLILYFKPGAREAWLQRDVASFLVSEVQRLYPEYECGGKML